MKTKPKYKTGDELRFRIEAVHPNGYTLQPGGWYIPLAFQDELVVVQEEASDEEGHH